MNYAIDVRKKVVLGELPQKIHVRGTRAENPIILFLHGGPGVTNRHSMMKNNSDLCDDFTIVSWDQRGTGGSYKGCKPETLTLDRLVDDAKELCEYLMKTYQKKGVFICGGSWGTELGTYLAYRYPEVVLGYIGYGQVVNGVDNERLCYDFTLKGAEEAGNQEDIETLKRVGPPVDGVYKPCFEGLMAQRKLLTKYGGHNMKKQSFWQGTVKPILLSSEYSLEDKIGITKGYKFVLSNMWEKITKYDFKKDCNTFKVPYYIFQGKFDNCTPSALIQDYFDSITAPDKDLVWFEHSSHGPLSEEPEKFKKLIREKFLKIDKE